MMDFSVDNQINVRNRSRLFIYVLLGIVIIISGDTLLFGTNSNSMMINIKYFVHVALFAGLSMLTILKNIKINKNALFVYLVLIFIILLSGFINNELSFGYYYKILIITLSLLITTFIPLSTFILYYDKIITYLASLSLLGYGTYQLFNGIVRFFPTITNTANREFYNLFITHIPNYGYGGVLIRNWGIFREPGVFQMYLILGLLIQLFILKRPKLFSIIVYITAIITTFSTTAYIALFITIGAYFIIKNKNDRRMKRLLFAFIIFSATFIIFMYTEQLNRYINSVFGKLGDLSNHSTAARFASIVVNIKVFFENPLLGIGFNNLAEVFPRYALQRTGVFVEDNTNMILIQFASHGIVYGSLWVLGYWETSRKMARNLKNRILKSVIFFVVFMILFVGANLTWGFLTYVLLFYGFNKRNEEKVL